MQRNAKCATVGSVPANFIPWKAKGKVMKIRLLQRYGQNDIGTILDRTKAEAEWMVYQGRAEPADVDSGRPERPAEPAQPVRSREEAVTVQDTSPTPEPPAQDAPPGPVKRGPGRPPKGGR